MYWEVSLVGCRIVTRASILACFTGKIAELRNAVCFKEFLQGVKKSGVVILVIKRFPCPMHSFIHSYHYIHYIHCVDYFPCYLGLGCNITAFDVFQSTLLTPDRLKPATLRAWGVG